jgi:hypothetical protein
MVKRLISATVFGSALMLSLPLTTAHAAGPGFSAITQGLL